MNRLQSERSCDFEQFVVLLHDLLQAAWGPKWGTFCEAFPNGNNPADVKLPVITYSLTNMQPGIISEKSGTREIKARPREIITPDEKGAPESILVYSQRFDCMIMFELWAENNKQANEFAKKFREFMMIYTGYFMQMGVRQMIFSNMSNDTLDNTAPVKENAVSRQFNYFVQLEEHAVVPTSVLHKVTGQVSAKRDSNPDSPNQYINF